MDEKLLRRQAYFRVTVFFLIVVTIGFFASGIGAVIGG